MRIIIFDKKKAIWYCFFGVLLLYYPTALNANSFGFGAHQHHHPHNQPPNKALTGISNQLPTTFSPTPPRSLFT